VFLVRFSAAVAVVLTVSACAGYPWIDSRREAGIPDGRIGESTADRPAICHAPGESRATLQALAQRVCSETGRSAVYEGTIKYQCVLMTPHRSYFVCK
jgi:hypothetical protein